MATASRGRLDFGARSSASLAPVSPSGGGGGASRRGSGSGRRMSGTVPPLGADERVTRLDDMQRRYKLLDRDRSAFVEHQRWKIRTLKDKVAHLTSLNRGLRDDLQTFARDEEEGEEVLVGERERLKQGIFRLRQQHDRAVAEMEVAKEQEIEIGQELRILQRTLRAQALTGANPNMQRVRALENRLDKAMIRYNETQVIRRTYTEVLRKLQDERAGFDAQLKRMEADLSAKECEIVELTAMHADAASVRDATVQELERYSAEIEAEREAVVKEIEQLRAQAEAREARRAAGSGGEEEGGGGDDGGGDLGAGESAVVDDAAATTYEEAFKRIKEATGVTDVNDLIRKVLTQDDTLRNLLSLKGEALTRIEVLQDDKVALRQRADEIKFSGSASVGGRRAVDDYEERVGEVVSSCELARQRYERTAKILVTVKAGVSHLSDLLEGVRLDVPSQEVSDETVVQVLWHCEQKLVKLLDQLGGVDALSGAQERVLARPMAEPETSAANVRVRRQSVEHSSDGSDGEEEDVELGGERAPGRDEIKLKALQQLDSQRKRGRSARRAAGGGGGGGAGASAGSSGGAVVGSGSAAGGGAGAAAPVSGDLRTTSGGSGTLRARSRPGLGSGTAGSGDAQGARLLGRRADLE